MHSRNNRCGILLGQRVSVENAVQQIGMVVEGLNALPAAIELSQKYNVEMPITETIANIVAGKMDVTAAVEVLMSRGLKADEEKSNQQKHLHPFPFQKQKKTSESPCIFSNSRKTFQICQNIIFQFFYRVVTFRWRTMHCFEDNELEYQGDMSSAVDFFPDRNDFSICRILNNLIFCLPADWRVEGEHGIKNCTQ